MKIFLCILVAVIYVFINGMFWGKADMYFKKKDNISRLICFAKWVIFNCTILNLLLMITLFR